MTSEQKQVNAEMVKCMNQTEKQWIPCSHVYCINPENCVESELVAVKTSRCDITSSGAKEDKCLTCGKTYTY